MWKQKLLGRAENNEAKDKLIKYGTTKGREADKFYRVKFWELQTQAFISKPRFISTTWARKRNKMTSCKQVYLANIKESSTFLAPGSR